MKITKDTTIGEILHNNIFALMVLQQHDMQCNNCAAKYNVPIESCAKTHGVDLETLMAELREL